jgi:hypothetical protein
LASGRAELSEATAAADPELVAVFDLAGPVDDFYKAAAKVPGLEFLFTVEGESLAPDDDFFFSDEDGDVQDREVPQSLYMVMTSARALTELIRIFDLWKADPKVRLSRGLAPLKTVFALLRSIRRWGPTDRVHETGLIETWRADAAVAGAQTMRVELELWYRSDSTRRDQAAAAVASAIEAANGQVITSSVISEISHHGILAEIPRDQVERVLRDGVDSIELLAVEDVMLACPSVQWTSHFPDARSSLSDGTVDESTATGDPRVALLDGVPLANHVALAHRLIIDDPDGHSTAYSPAQQCHGTAMSSLIIHGAATETVPALKNPLYVRPILRPHSFLTDWETFPNDELLVDLLYRSLKRIFEGDQDGVPVAPSVRIVNLSIGDPARTFVRRMSPHARLLDWFAHKYNVIFVVSAGNHDGAESEPTVSLSTIDDPEALHTEALRSLRDSVRLRRLLAPAEAINAITVGATHSDGADPRTLPATVVDPLADGVPASYSSVGFGYRRAVKPEVLLPGGRQIFQRPVESQDSQVKLEQTPVADVAGLAVAAPGLAGELDGIALTCGTSNAAALASHSVARILEMLETPDVDAGDFEFPADEYHPVLAKALFIHAASWGDLKQTLVQGLDITGQGTRHTITQLLGYGAVNDTRLMTATSRRVVLVGAATIHADERHSYHFPLPSALRAQAEWKRLTVTLAWISEVNPRTQRYRMARLSFAAPRDPLGVDSTEADARAMTRGTVQHQVLEGRSAAVFDEGDSVAMDVDCRVDVGSKKTETRYGLVASLEVGTTIQADIHAQIRDALRTRVQQQVRERVRPTPS